ncbi:conserved hypothetical protein, partial [Ricinus communis]
MGMGGCVPLEAHDGIGLELDGLGHLGHGQHPQVGHHPLGQQAYVPAQLGGAQQHGKQIAFHHPLGLLHELEHHLFSQLGLQREGRRGGRAVVGAQAGLRGLQALQQLAFYGRVERDDMQGGAFARQPLADGVTQAQTHHLGQMQHVLGLASGIRQGFQDGFHMPYRHLLAQQVLQHTLYVTDGQHGGNQLFHQAGLVLAHAIEQPVHLGPRQQRGRFASQHFRQMRHEDSGRVHQRELGDRGGGALVLLDPECGQAVGRVPRGLPGHSIGPAGRMDGQQAVGPRLATPAHHAVDMDLVPVLPQPRNVLEAHT